LATSAGFVAFDWPQQLDQAPIRAWEPPKDALDQLEKAAAKHVQQLLDEQTTRSAKDCTDYLAIGVDSQAPIEKNTKRHRDIRSSQFVCIVDLRKPPLGPHAFTLIGKFYPTPEEQRRLVRFPEFNSHFLDMGDVTAMVLVCNDITVFSPRGQARLRHNSPRWKISDGFHRLLAERRKPNYVIHAAHVTIQTAAWRASLCRPRETLQTICCLSCGPYYSANNHKWRNRDELDEVRSSTKWGRVMDVIATVKRD